MARIRYALLSLLALGCARESNLSEPIQLSSEREFPSVGDDPWVLTSRKPSSTPALLWNGLIGVRIGPSGTGVDAEGKQLPFFAIDAYETTGSEKIIQLPNPLAVELILDGKAVDPSKADRWFQALDMRTGVLTTEWENRWAEHGFYRVRCETVLHPEQRQIAQRWTLEHEGGRKLEAKALVGPDRLGAQGPMARYASTTSGFDPASGRLESGSKATIERTVAFGNSPSAAAIRGVLIEASVSKALPFDQVLEESKSVWAERWKTDIEIDGPIEDQQAVRSWLFFLRSAIHPNGNMSISPMSLSAQDYNGHVFWDADLWVFLALALIDPLIAAEIPSYRLARQPTYDDEFGKWLAAGRPVVNRTMSDPDPPGLLRKRSSAVKVPWESSISGKEVSPQGQWRFQDHITGTTTFAMDLASAFGLVDHEQAREFRYRARTFYSSRVEGSAEGVKELKSTMSPDEHHIADNDLYTNLVAQWCLMDGRWVDPPQRSSQPPILRLPRDEMSFLSYDNDPIRSYKQAAAVLAIYPLQYPPAEKQAKVMMERFADKVIKNGPAMSDSIHAIIWARLGEEAKAYQAWQDGWREFARPPHLLFSETRRTDETYFTTGAAGCLQTVIYGFLGFRIDSKPETGAAWSKKLKGDRWLSIRPHLPQAWKKVKFKNFTVLGERFTLTATRDDVAISPGEES